MKTGGVMLAHVGQHRIDHIGPGRGRPSFGRAGDRGAVKGFAQVDHLGHLVPHMGSLGGALDLGQIGHRPGQDIDQAGFASPVIGPVVGGETIDQGVGEFRLPVHEYPLRRDKDILEGDESLAADPPEKEVPGIDPFPVVLAVVVGLTSEDHRYPGGVGRHRADHGVVFGFLIHGRGRHDQDLMRVDPSGHVQLGPADDKAVVPALDDTEILVRIDLLGRPFGAVPLGIGHRPDHHRILLLDIGQPLLEALEIVGAALPVDFIRHRIDGVDAIEPHTALETRAGLLTQDAQQFDLFEKILHVLVHMGKTADGLAGQMGDGRGQLLIFRVARQGVGHGRGPDMRGRGRMACHILYPLPLVIDLMVQLPQTFQVILCSFDLHPNTSSYRSHPRNR